MRDAGLSITYGVPPGMGPGEVTHLPVESGRHVAAGEPVVTVRTEADYHTLRAERGGTVIVLVRPGEKVAPEAPLVILQVDQDAPAPTDNVEAAVPPARPRARAETDGAPEPEPLRHGPPPAWPMEITRPKQRPAGPARNDTGQALEPRRPYSLRVGRRGRRQGTALRIGIAIVLYLAGVFWVLPEESARLAEAGNLRRAGVVVAATFLGGLIWAALGRGGSAAAARSIAAIVVVWAGVAGLTAFSLLPMGKVMDRAAVAAAAASHEPFIPTLGRQSMRDVNDAGGPMALNSRWLDILRRAPNGASLAKQASLHQKLRSTLIDRPMLPGTAPRGSMNLPTNLPPRTRIATPPRIRAAHTPAGTSRMAPTTSDLSVWDSLVTVPTEVLAGDSAPAADPAQLRPAALSPDG